MSRRFYHSLAMILVSGYDIPAMRDRLLKWLEGPMIMIRDLLLQHQKQTGQLPAFYFYEFSKLVPMPAYELLILRGEPGKREVLLTQREADDPFWPSAWHFPGTIIRNGDSINKIHERLAKEIEETALFGMPKLFEFDITDNHRGWGTHTFFTLEWTGGEPKNGKFFLLTSLPEPIIPHQQKQLERFGAELDKEA